MSKEKREFFSIVSETEDEAVIEIYGTIGGWDWDDWKQINTIKTISKELNELKALNTKQILVKINSYGGDCNHALAIHDALKDHSAKIITQANGYVASAGTIIFMAGEERKISKGALFLIHKCSSWAWGNENEIEAELDGQRKTNETMLSIYEINCKKNRADIETLMNENNGTGKWITAQDALDYGFATEIYNDTTSAKAAIDKRAFAAFRFPPVPEGYDFETAEEKEPTWAQKLYTKLDNLINRRLQPTDTDHHTNTNQTEKNMQKLSAVFPKLFALLAFKTDSDYDPEKGHSLSDTEMKALEAKIAEFNAEKEKFAADKTELEGKLTTMTTSRDELQTKLNAVPNLESFPNPSGKDTTGKMSYAQLQEQDEKYKALKEEYEY